MDVLSSYRHILDDTAARDYFIREIHGGVCKCPSCGHGGNITRYRNGQRIKCPTCGKWYTYATDTVLAGVKLAPGVLLSLLAFLAAGLSDETISKLLGVTTETVRLWRIRKQEGVI